MKFKTTKKAMKENYNKIAKIGYCNAQFLLKYIEPTAYSTRAEGWACDYYDINGILISTGYAPIEPKNTNCTYDIVKIYDDKAREIVYGNDDYKTKVEKVNVLLSEFVATITV